MKAAQREKKTDTSKAAVRPLRTSSAKSSSLSATNTDCSLDLCDGDCGSRPAFERLKFGPEAYPFWPRRLNAEMAAAYCGEASTRAFLARVGTNKEFPLPSVREGRRVLWLKDDLDKAMGPRGSESERDIAGDF
jgi:hypothetical protein